MSPEQKRSRGMGVVGYLRVSSRGQVGGWSLSHQEDLIRTWAKQHHLPVIAIEHAAEGWESGASELADRAGWQAVERHIATGKVGWIAVAAVDRLSRNLQDLADQVDRWNRSGIAIVAPGLGYAHLEGIGSFLMQFFGMQAEHERTRLIGRVLPGMKTRIEHGLPLGTQPFGYRIEDCVSGGYHASTTSRAIPGESSPSSGKPRRCLVPDPATAPIVTALFHYAESHPDLGDRRLAAWASAQWPSHTFSYGRVAGILSNRLYTGAFHGRVGDTEVLLLGNHPHLVEPAIFAAVQHQRKQRAQDRADGSTSIADSSLLGGYARCDACGGVVYWRARAPAGLGEQPGDGPRYICTGTPGHTGTMVHGRRLPGCGRAWEQAIDNFVYQAVEAALTVGVEKLRAMVDDAIEQIPQHLDERRRQAGLLKNSLAGKEEEFNTALGIGQLSTEAYAQAIASLQEQRAKADALLQETDGWAYLAKLVVAKEGAGAGTYRWIPMSLIWSSLTKPQQRRLIRAVFPELRLIGLETPRFFEEAPDKGRYIGVQVPQALPEKGVPALVPALAKLLTHHPGLDLVRGRKEIFEAGPSKQASDLGEVVGGRADDSNLDFDHQ